MGRGDGCRCDVSHLLCYCCWQYGHFPLSTAASIGLSKAFGPFTVFSFHLSLDNSLCILNKDFILPTRRKLLTRCSWACRYLTSSYCCVSSSAIWSFSLFRQALAPSRDSVPRLDLHLIYNYPLVCSGKTWDIASEGRMGDEWSPFLLLPPKSTQYELTVIASCNVYMFLLLILWCKQDWDWTKALRMIAPSLRI